MVSSKSRLALKRQLLFALLMSLVTVNIVSIAILLIHGVPLALLFEKWLTSIAVAWPIVFISILLVAPWLLRLTERLIKDHD
jgi:CBS domain containing-hemolysin-like protein